jgi:RHS repeat-associated protein
LGNIRVTIDDDTSVVGYNDYYPFGKQMPERCMNNANSEDVYKFSGKELDEEYDLDYYYFGARYYDPAIGRWMVVDPLAGKYPSYSPYNYALNNPINIFDPDGRDITIVIDRTRDNGTTTMGNVTVNSDLTDETFDGYTLEPSATDETKPRMSAGEYSAYQRGVSVDGRRTYDPNRIHLIGVTDENNNDMPGAQIHIGNEPGDTEGCALVGTTEQEDYVGDSETALRSINNVINADGSGNITVIVNDPPTNNPTVPELDPPPDLQEPE